MTTQVAHAKAALIENRMRVDELMADMRQLNLSELQLRGVVVVLHHSYQALAHHFETILNALARLQQQELPT